MKRNILRATQAAGVAFLLAVGTAAFADDLDDAYAALQAANKGSDVAAIKKAALDTCAAVKKLAATTPPDNPTEKEDYAKRVEWSKSVQLEAEYAMYAAALKSPGATQIELLSAIQEENPKSRYMEIGYSVLLGAYTTAGEPAKATATAEAAIANFPSNIDALLLLTDESYRKGQKDKALGYARKMVAAAGKSKPEDLPAGDWERLKSSALSRGYWYAGVIEGEKSVYFDCNRDLRLALPMVKGNEGMVGAALYYLGVSNYKIGHETANKQMLVEAQKYFEQAAQIKGPYAQNAYQSAAIIKGEVSKMR